MSEQVYWTIAGTINDGKYADLEALCTAATEQTRTGDAGAIHYEWWANESKSEIHIHERYTDSAAVMGHMANVAEAIGQLMGLITVTSVHVYGAPDASVRAAFADFQPTYFTTSLGGFSR